MASHSFHFTSNLINSQLRFAYTSNSPLYSLLDSAHNSNSVSFYQLFLFPISATIGRGTMKKPKQERSGSRSTTSAPSKPTHPDTEPLPCSRTPGAKTWKENRCRTFWMNARKAVTQLRKSFGARPAAVCSSGDCAASSSTGLSTTGSWDSPTVINFAVIGNKCDAPNTGGQAEISSSESVAVPNVCGQCNYQAADCSTDLHPFNLQKWKQFDTTSS